MLYKTPDNEHGQKKTLLDTPKEKQNHLSLVTNLAEFHSFHQSYSWEAFSLLNIFSIIIN